MSKRTMHFKFSENIVINGDTNYKGKLFPFKTR